MSKPLMSLFATAYRTQYWMNLYDSVSDSSIPFEIVFTGPNEPDFTLPDNFKYIKTADIKPSQCVEIATRYSVGEIIMQIADDLEFVTSDSLGILYSEYKGYNNEKLMLSPRYLKDGVDLSVVSLRFFDGDLTSPTLAVGMILSNKLYRTLGGIDKNFLAIHGESDVAMRLQSIGGKVLVSSIAINEFKERNEGSSMCDDAWTVDRPFLEKLWVVKHKAQFKRAQPFEPFSNYKILEESQGVKGKWL